MLLFTNGRAQALRRQRDPGTWLAEAQSAAKSAAQSVDPAAVLDHARSDVADVVRHIRSAAPEIAGELAATKPAAIRKSVANALPTRRRRRSRWPLLVLGALGLAMLATLAARLLARRRAGARTLPSRWEPSLTGSGVMHPPRGVAPDTSPSAETLDRDASSRATDEGMAAPDQPVPGRSLGAAATSGAQGRLAGDHGQLATDASSVDAADRTQDSL